MELKDIIKKKKCNVMSARVTAESRNYIKKNRINISKLIEESIKELKRGKRK